MGCKLLIILAVVAEKNFKECSTKLWPIAVLKSASKSKYGNWAFKPNRSIKNKVGRSKTVVINV